MGDLHAQRQLSRHGIAVAGTVDEPFERGGGRQGLEHAGGDGSDLRRVERRQLAHDVGLGLPVRAARLFDGDDVVIAGLCVVRVGDAGQAQLVGLLGQAELLADGLPLRLRQLEVVLGQQQVEVGTGHA